MRKLEARYYIFLPTELSFASDTKPIAIKDCRTGKIKNVSLRKAQEFVFSAVLRNDPMQIDESCDDVFTVICVYDRADIEALGNQFLVTPINQGDE